MNTLPLSPTSPSHSPTITNITIHTPTITNIIHHTNHHFHTLQLYHKHHHTTLSQRCHLPTLTEVFPVVISCCQEASYRVSRLLDEVRTRIDGGHSTNTLICCDSYRDERIKRVKYVGAQECEEQVSMRYAAVKCRTNSHNGIRHISVGSTPLEYTLMYSCTHSSEEIATCIVSHQSQGPDSISFQYMNIQLI